MCQRGDTGERRQRRDKAVGGQIMLIHRGLWLSKLVSNGLLIEIIVRKTVLVLERCYYIIRY